nr:dienelactone hydrolase family protein [Desulfobulbaceae bacterium]
MLLRILKRVSCFIFIVPLISCTSAHQFINHADNIARQNYLSKKIVRTNLFSLVTYSKFNDTGQSVHVYIEGDGHAFTANKYPSSDPTPHDPVALRLAALDPQPNVLYIARPYQYLGEQSDAEQKYWTSHRFSQDVVDAVDQAIDLYKEPVHSSRIKLFGFSGGGAIATLLSAQRGDVDFLVTIAGNLDHRMHSEIHKVDRLKGSLDPIDHVARLIGVEQIHLVGENDRIVPKEIAEYFCQMSRDAGGRCQVIKVRGVSHANGWAKLWPRLLKDRF